MCNRVKPHPFIQILSLTCECYLKDWIPGLLTLPISSSFNLIYGRKLREELVCSMIMRSENAVLRDSNNNKDDSLSYLQAARVSKYCSLLLFVIRSINTISVNVAVLQIGNIFFA